MCGRMKAMRRIMVGLVVVWLAGCAAPANRLPLPEPAERLAATTIYLATDGPADPRATVSIAADGPVDLRFVVRDRGRMRVVARCDGRARAMPEGFVLSPPGWSAPDTLVMLDLGPGERWQQRISLAPETAQCHLTVTPGGYPAWGVTVQRQALAVDRPLQRCAGDGDGPSLSGGIMASGGLSMTCPVAAGRVEILDDGLDALALRVEALTGTRVSRAALERGDPDMALDFSRAPDLELIYVNYLNINADFVGYLTARMLAWHAARGTAVRLLLSDIMLTDADRALFEGLAARYPSVQIQSYRFPALAATDGEAQVARLHRIAHVKLFATLARDPGRSVAIIGGRNLHEGYFFLTPRDLSAYPALEQYDPADTRLTGGFTAFDDFELALHDDQAVRTVVQHMGQLWNRDSITQAPVVDARPPLHRPMREGQMRHFLSVPFADGAAQLQYFVGLFDAAQTSIRIAVPYLNLPEPLEQALGRAVARGVRVEVVTTVESREAAEFMITGQNVLFGNRFAGQVAFYDYDPPEVLLHSKLFVIDGRVALVASTNLNQRSFYHDLENGLVFQDRAIARQIDRVIQRYIDGAEPFTPGRPVSGLVRALDRIGVIDRAF